MKRLSFEKRDKIYLLYKNIIIKRSNNKLNFKKFANLYQDQSKYNKEESK